MTAERRRDALRFGLRPPLRAPLRRCYTTPGDTTITAVMRKLIVLANALLRDNRSWTEKTA